MSAARPVALAAGLVLLVTLAAALQTGDRPTAASDSAPEVTAAHHSGSRSGEVWTPRSRRGCVFRPSDCGYPDATTTGLRDPGALSRSGPVTADREGEVIQDLDIKGELNITADDVVVRNVRVTASSGDWVVIIRPGVHHVTIKDSEIMSPPGAVVDNACIFNISDARPRMIRLDIHGCSAGVSSGGGRLRDSFVHDPGFTPGLSHVTLVASNGGGHMTVTHNTILNPENQTAAVAFYQDFGPQGDDLVVDNLLAGGGYVVYGGSGGEKTHDIRFIGNRFSRLYHRRGGYYGVVASFDLHDPGNRWSGNYWDDTLEAVRS